MSNMAEKYQLTAEDVERVIQMAWEDRTPFEAIEYQFGMPEKDVIVLMRENMKRPSFKLWRKRVTGRATKHRKVRAFDTGRFKSDNQKTYRDNS